MANAVKRISVMRGHDVTDYTLQCFGGAGGQHAGLVADALGMTRVFIHPLAGVLSAFGMGLADQVAMREAAVEHDLDDRGLDGRADDRLTSAAGGRRGAQGAGAGRRGAAYRIADTYPLSGHRHGAVLRTAGAIAAGEALQAIREEFERSYRRRFEFVMPDHGSRSRPLPWNALRPGRLCRRRHCAAGGAV